MNPTAWLIAGLGFGDEGKGSAVDYLARRIHNCWVIRYNGGAQAGHNVVTAIGQHHTFSQLGSNSFLRNAQTYLSEFMMVNPLAMMKEIEGFLQQYPCGYATPSQVMARMIKMSKECLVTTPFHRAVNRLKEWARKDHRHGSCGLGIGETRQFAIDNPSYALRVSDFYDGDRLPQKLDRIQEIYRPQVVDLVSQITLLPEVQAETAWFKDKTCNIYELAAAYNRWMPHLAPKLYQTPKLYQKASGESLIFEGAQGVLLDEDYGAPHNTWSKTTFDNAYAILTQEAFSGYVRRIGCLRAYHTRHGTGPLPTEDPTLNFLEPHNTSDSFQGNFRRGHLDVGLVKTALEYIGGVDEIWLSHLDQAPHFQLQVSDSQRESLAPDAFVNRLEELLDTPITLIGRGPTANDRHSRISRLPLRRSAEMLEGIPCGFAGPAKIRQSLP